MLAIPTSGDDGSYRRGSRYRPLMSPCRRMAHQLARGVGGESKPLAGSQHVKSPFRFGLSLLQ